MSFRLTEAADDDIKRILADTLELFGPNQLKAYSGLIEAALARVGSDPTGLGTTERDDVGPGVRSLHLDTVARRRGSAAHRLYYLPPGNENSATLVLRVLHNQMEPRNLGTE